MPLWGDCSWCRKDKEKDRDPVNTRRGFAWAEVFMFLILHFSSSWKCDMIYLLTKNYSLFYISETLNLQKCICGGKGLKHEGKGNLGEWLRREVRKFTTVERYLFWAPGRVCSPSDIGPKKMENTWSQAILLEGRGFYSLLLLVHTAAWQSLVQTIKGKTISPAAETHSVF